MDIERMDSTEHENEMERDSDARGPGTYTPGPGNAPEAQVATSDPDPLAYRNKGDNAKLRAEHMERVIIELAYGGSTARFDDAAGVNRDA